MIYSAASAGQGAPDQTRPEAGTDYDYGIYIEYQISKEFEVNPHGVHGFVRAVLVHREIQTRYAGTETVPSCFEPWGRSTLIWLDDAGVQRLKQDWTRMEAQHSCGRQLWSIQCSHTMLVSCCTSLQHESTDCTVHNPSVSS
jgi:hypothetical protein